MINPASEVAPHTTPTRRRRLRPAGNYRNLASFQTARSSLEELLLDYEDYLRHRHLPRWEPNGPDAQAVRAIGRNLNLTERSDLERWDLYAPWLAHPDPSVRANAAICLIHQGNYLLDQQLAALEEAFIEDGGYSEQLASARLAQRTRGTHTDPPDRPDPADPIPKCPQCGKPMALRTAKTGKHSGRQFWGCTGYPECRGSAEV